MRPFKLIKQIGKRLINTGKYASPSEARHLFAIDMGYRNFRDMELHAEHDIKWGLRKDLHGKLREIENQMRSDGHWAIREVAR